MPAGLRSDPRTIREDLAGTRANAGSCRPGGEAVSDDVLIMRNGGGCVAQISTWGR